MTGFEWMVTTTCAVMIAFYVTMVLMAACVIGSLVRIERHLDAQGPELMKHTRWLQIMAAHAWMQRSYLQKLCVRAGVSIFEKEEEHDPDREAGCPDTGADVGTDPTQ